MSNAAENDPSSAPSGPLPILPILGQAEIEARFDPVRVKEALRDAFLGLGDGQSVQPPQSLVVLPEDRGDFICYLGVLAKKGIFGVKLSPYLPARIQRGEAPVTAYTLLMSIDTGRPLLLCDSLALTTERTAATTALALDYLTPAGAETLAVIGAGAQARRHLVYAAAQQDWQEIAVYAPSLTNASATGYQAKREAMEAVCGNVRLAPNAESAVRDADVVLLCTSSGTPVIEASWLKDRVTLTSISTNVARAHEIDPASLGAFSVYCDYLATAPLSAGEMVIAREKHGWDDERIVADLPALVAGVPGSSRPKAGPVFFRSIGLGIEDLAVAGLLL